MHHRELLKRQSFFHSAEMFYEETRAYSITAFQLVWVFFSVHIQEYILTTSYLHSVHRLQSSFAVISNECTKVNRKVKLARKKSISGSVFMGKGNFHNAAVATFCVNGIVILASIHTCNRVHFCSFSRSQFKRSPLTFCQVIRPSKYVFYADDQLICSLFSLTEMYSYGKP